MVVIRKVGGGMSFQLCLNASTIRPTGLEEKIRIAAEAGYQGIELWHREIEEYVERGGRLRVLKRLIVDSGLRVPSTINLKGWFEAESEGDPVWGLCRRRMEDAAELGAEFIVAGPPQERGCLERGAENYGRLLRMGREMGVRPAMEFLGFVAGINTIERAREVVRGCGEEGGTIVMDPFHVFRGGGEFGEVARLEAGEIAVCHFNDATFEIDRELQTDGDRVMPGEGELPLVEMLRDLIRIGYSKWLSLELFSRGLWERDAEEVAGEGLARMRELIKKMED